MIVPSSAEVQRERRRRCGCAPCLIEQRLDELVAAVNGSPMRPAQRLRVILAMLDAAVAIDMRPTS